PTTTGCNVPERISVTCEGRCYVWDGTHWYCEVDYTVPALGLRNRLNLLALDILAADDAEATDTKELASRASRAGAAGQYERADQLEKRIEILRLREAIPEDLRLLRSLLRSAESAKSRGDVQEQMKGLDRFVLCLQRLKRAYRSHSDI